jgi:5-methylthioadenosine/S-adenosylhomocysteine deaminase
MHKFQSPILLCTLVLSIFASLSASLSASPSLAAEPREHADLIVHGDYVLTMVEGKSAFRDAALAIRDGTIIDILPGTEAEARYEAARVIQGKNRVVMPGLINGHTHTAMTLFRGMVDDLDLMSWLNDYVFPMERAVCHAGVCPRGQRAGVLGDDSWWDDDFRRHVLLSG